MFNVVLYYWLRNFSNLIGCKRAVFQPNLKYLHVKNYSCHGNERNGFVLLLKQWRIAFPNLTTVKYIKAARDILGQF